MKLMTIKIVIENLVNTLDLTEEDLNSLDEDISCIDFEDIIKSQIQPLLVDKIKVEVIL